MRTYFTIVFLLATQSLFAADSPSKYALFVGVAKYNHTDLNRPQLEFPEVDAKELAEIFRKSGYSVDLLLGKEATQDAIKSKLKAIDDKGNSDGVVVLGFFGHGIEFESTKLACYCPFNTKFRDVVDAQGRARSNDDGSPMIEPDPASLITMSELLSALRRSPAGNRILLADCCRNDPKAARGRAFGANVKMTDLPRNTAALFACSEGEQAFEHSLWKHGAFTKCLIDEIQSPGSRVTAGKLADELQPKVKNLVAEATGGKRQTLNPIVNGVVDFQLSLSTSTTKTNPPTTTPPSTTKPAPPNQPTKPQEASSRGFEGTRPGESKELVTSIVFHWCPAGPFTMGSPKTELGRGIEEDQVNVTLTKGFWLGETEVTEGQYQQLMGKAVKTADFPVTNVTHDEAVSFCQKLTTQERASGRLPKEWKYSLPTEAEWEYACRAGTKTKYSFGASESQLADYGWFGKNSSGVSNRVGQKKANAWELKDMHGNVREWCSDRYDEKLVGGVDPQGPSSGFGRVLRGGCWVDVADNCRSAYRDVRSPDFRSYFLGFRLAAVPTD